MLELPFIVVFLQLLCKIDINLTTPNGKYRDFPCAVTTLFPPVPNLQHVATPGFLKLEIRFFLKKKAGNLLLVTTSGGLGGGVVKIQLHGASCSPNKLERAESDDNRGWDAINIFLINSLHPKI